jgi:hypothetical protein
VRGDARAASAALALLVAHAGCAITGTYEPRPSPRITPLDVTGQRVFVRDGRRQEVGLLGGGATELVRRDDAAVAEARKYRRDRLLAWTFSAASLGAFGAGAYFGLEKDQRHRGLGADLFFGGFLSSLVSLGLASAAAHDLMNAVTIFNDDLEGPSAARAPPYAPP